MSDRKIQSLLREALEEHIPSAEIALWQQVRAGLDTGNHSITRQGAAMNTSIQRRRFAFTAVMTFALLALALLTPPGRAFAQDFISKFFTRTESDTFYMEPSDLTFEDTTPFHELCGISIFPKCSVEQVRSLVDFEVKELGTIPEGLYFVGATGGPDFIELKYGYEDRLDGNLGVIVEAVGRPSGIGTGIAARSADIQEVQVGDLPAEYYTGVLFQDDEGNVTWNPDDPTATLRWEDGGSTYTLVYFSTHFPMTREQLIALAESMTLEPVDKKPLPPGFIR